jgi:hypothetical protein
MCDTHPQGLLQGSNQITYVKTYIAVAGAQDGSRMLAVTICDYYCGCGGDGYTWGTL